MNPGGARQPKGPEAGRSLVHASALLQRLLDEAPTEHFTLAWVITSLGERSFGSIMLLLAVVAIAPAISIGAGLLIIIPAFQLLAGRSAPVFPRRISARPLPTRYLTVWVQRAVPVLRYLETIVHPRWPTVLEPTRRLVGTVVMLLGASLVFAPILLATSCPPW